MVFLVVEHLRKTSQHEPVNAGDVQRNVRTYVGIEALIQSILPLFQFVYRLPRSCPKAVRELSIAAIPSFRENLYSCERLTPKKEDETMVKKAISTLTAFVMVVVIAAAPALACEDNRGRNAVIGSGIGGVAGGVATGATLALTTSVAAKTIAVTASCALSAPVCIGGLAVGTAFGALIGWLSGKPSTDCSR